MVLDHLSQLESGQARGSVDDQQPDCHMFRVEAILDYLEHIALFLETGKFQEYIATQQRHMVFRAVDYQQIIGHLYEMGVDQILQQCFPGHQKQDVLWECHSGVASGHMSRKATTRNFLQEEIQWPTHFRDAKKYFQECDVFQCMGNPSHWDEIPFQPIWALWAFMKFVVEFLGSINPRVHHSHAQCIITLTYYLTIWAEFAPVKYCTTCTTTKFIFENVITQFGCPHSLKSDQGTHSINQTFTSLLQNFMIQQHKRTSHYPQENDTVEDFNKILERGLTKVCSPNSDDWDEQVSNKFWAYHTTINHLHKYMTFYLVYV